MEFDTRAGWKFFVVGVGTSFFRGTFTIRAWVEKNTAIPVIILEDGSNSPDPKPDIQTTSVS